MATIALALSVALAAASRPRRWVPVAGAVGCVVLALTVPPASVLAGLAVLAAGAVVRVVVERRRDAPDAARVR